MTSFKTPRPDALFIDPAQSLVVRVHPMVLLSILDHYNRRPEKQGRVIGTLLGSTVSSVSGIDQLCTQSSDGGAYPASTRARWQMVEITNAFGVPHAEAGDDVALGQDYHRTMNHMYMCINDKERIVGW